MNPGEYVPIFGMLTGLLITGLFFWTGVQVFRGPIGQAIARRINGHQGEALTPEVVEELRQLHEQVDTLQHQLAETQERVEFTERLLAQGRAPESLPRS
ncbi:MAG: hypothetical protein U0133_07655 [Gemmatimonadales bacterium]